MNRYFVKVPKDNEVEVKRYLTRQRPDLFWYTTWVSGLGHLTVITFNSQEEAVEFQLKFLGNIDY